jgi:diguanylate cyclase (GGDEF)-like protein/PAS domain S-box-containing protein
MLIVADTSELNNTDARVFFIGEPLAVNAASDKNISTRLPLLAAIFVALVCVAIVGLSCWREWSARDLDLKHAEVEMANLTRSLTGHAEDTIELGESILAGIVSGLETDGINPARIGRLQTLFARQMQGRQRMVAALSSSEANFRVLAEGSSDMVTRIGLDERVYYASPSSVRIVGWRPDQLVGTPALAGVNPEDLPGVLETVAALKRGEAEEARISYRTRHREKSEIWVETTLRITRKGTGEVDGVVAISRDITEQKNLEGKLETLATEDSLTGLANRRRFDERLQEEWARAYRDGKPLSLLMIDVDHFKKFNDEYGHPAGGACLRSVAKVLAAEARRPGDLAVRYGGEEFVLLLPNTEAAGCEQVGERIRAGLRKLGVIHVLNPPSKRVTVSLGGATMRPNAQRSMESSSLIAAGDRALYAAKGGGRDRLVMSGQVVALPALSAAR